MGKGGSSSPHPEDHSPWRAPTPQNKAEKLTKGDPATLEDRWLSAANSMYPGTLRSQIQFPGGKRFLVLSQKVSSHGQIDRIRSHNSINQKCNLLPRVRQQRTVKPCGASAATFPLNGVPSTQDPRPLKLPDRSAGTHPDPRIPGGSLTVLLWGNQCK